MGIAPGGVGNEQSFVGTDGLGKGLRTLRVKDLLQRRLRLWLRIEDGNHGVGRTRRRSDRAKGLGCAVNNHLTDIVKELLRAVFLLQRLQQIRIFGDETSVNNTVEKFLVLKHL